jgi:hypothetical protein
MITHSLKSATYLVYASYRSCKHGETLLVYFFLRYYMRTECVSTLRSEERKGTIFWMHTKRFSILLGEIDVVFNQHRIPIRRENFPFRTTEARWLKRRRFCLHSRGVRLGSQPGHRLSWGFSWFSSVPPGKFRNSTSNQTTESVVKYPKPQEKLNS